MGASWVVLRARSAAWILVALMVVAVGLAAASTPAQAAPSGRSRNAPVVFVHGFLLNLCPQEDVTATFATAMTELRTKGYTGPMESVAYYSCDSNGPSIQGSGDPNAYYPGGGDPPNINGTGTYGGRANGNTDDTDIKHIAYQLAWYLYNTYTAKGQTVEIVAHSMGGLIARWALYQEQQRNPLFPPALKVQDVVTFSTPNDGIDDGYGNTWCGASLHIQCTEMTPGSAFLNELHSSGMNPQGTGGTTWTALGSASCDIMPGTGATDVGDVYKVIYTGTAKPYCYDHTSYLTDNSDATDMPVQYRNPGDGAYTTITNGMHSLAWMASAVMGTHRASVPAGPATGPSAVDLNSTLAGVNQSIAGIHL